MTTGGWRTKDESVSMERLDGETILINFDSGQYFSFRGPAADVLWLVQHGVARSAWAEVLAGAYPGLTWDDAVDAQVDEFLRGLGEAGVIVEADAPTGPPAPLPDDGERGTWVAPSIEANDDLADLLILDPIHDASDDGWPQARSEA